MVNQNKLFSFKMKCKVKNVFLSDVERPVVAFSQYYTSRETTLLTSCLFCAYHGPPGNNFDNCLPRKYIHLSWQIYLPCLFRPFHYQMILSADRCLHQTITKTYLYDFDPFKPHLYIVKPGLSGVYSIFLNSAQKHRLCVLVRTTSRRI